ncbi:15264_t:CDS:10 [Funneliformis geosporum]|uniref:DASH complex subunit SPC19 n=1 Tax=Funneliformis geosporum TaxID=1117311 RepID=A0A9W4SFU3_9GLOM|nr:136_t:CDS:10 [Funneliformis geosporum]CAI2167641.1 15264_t:CDS:10 [Funneliformis geosporum]
MTPRRNDARFVSDDSRIPNTYIQSLEQSVYLLQDSTSKLQTSIHKLESGSRDFSKIKKLLACQRVCELVTEPEIRDAQSSLAAQLESRINALLSKAEEILQGLVEKDNMLQEEQQKDIKRELIELKKKVKKLEIECEQQSQVLNEIIEAQGEFQDALEEEEEQLGHALSQIEISCVQEDTLEEGIYDYSIEERNEVQPELASNQIDCAQEILLDAENKEIYINELSLEFPPEQDHLHRLQTAITLLNAFEITEIVCEEELKEGQNEDKMILRLKVDS